MTIHISLEVRAHDEAPANNLARLTDALSRGLHLSVKVEGSDLIGFVVRLDDAPFGPVAVVHLLNGPATQVLYCDPEELVIITPKNTIHN